MKCAQSVIYHHNETHQGLTLGRHVKCTIPQNILLELMMIFREWLFYHRHVKYIKL